MSLFDLSPLVERPARGRELLAVPLHRCPSCGFPLERETVEAGALFRHGGYGSTRQTVSLYCTAPAATGCNWSLLHQTNEVRP